MAVLMSDGFADLDHIFVDYKAKEASLGAFSIE